MNRKNHWEKVYTTKELNEVGWYQEKPVTSLKFIERLAPSKDAKIIDVGGGAYFLVDHLLDKSFTNVTVLDISKKSLEKAKFRLAERADMVEWIVQDVVDFQPVEKYDVWHDRAAFHFLTDETDVDKYVKLVSESIVENGHFIVGTFSIDGPGKCSGLEIVQYSEDSMLKTFGEYFTLDESLRIDHITPSGFKQNFIFCHFIRK